MTTFKKIDPKFKAKWLAALRGKRKTKAGNKYEQCDGRLKSPYRDAFCCLGVAQDLLMRSREVPSIDWKKFAPVATVSPGRNQVRWTKDESTTLAGAGYPTREAVEAIGLSAKAAAHLADMNDAGDSFEEIADWIEANL